MFDSVVARLTQISSKVGDIIEYLPRSIDDLFIWATLGSVPDCPKCNQVAMKCFCHHIDVLAEKGVDNEA